MTADPFLYMFQIADIGRRAGGEEGGEDVAAVIVILDFIQVFPVAGFTEQYFGREVALRQLLIEFTCQPGDFVVRPATSFLAAFPVVLRFIDRRDMCYGISFIQVMPGNIGHISRKIGIVFALQV